MSIELGVILQSVRSQPSAQIGVTYTPQTRNRWICVGEISYGDRPKVGCHGGLGPQQQVTPHRFV